MIDKIEIYKAWAPDIALWSAWVKPVIFTGAVMNTWNTLIIPEIGWSAELGRDTMIIVDLPGVRGIEEGLALTRLGYRPVPLYNGVSGPRNSLTIVDTREIDWALYLGMGTIQNAALRDDAPPAFLLDSRRMINARRRPGTYDNRWCVFPQDMPSAAFLQQQGIRKIIVRSDTIRNDLAHILGRYQEKDMMVYLCQDSAHLELKAKIRPSHFKSFYYRFQVLSGLTRNAAGGFGGMVPEPTQSGSGSRHYGMG